MAELTDDDVIKTALALSYQLETDPRPADREFVESLGWHHWSGNSHEWWAGPHVVELSLVTLGNLEKWTLRFNGESIIAEPTRGQVRTLLRLMDQGNDDRR